MTLNGVLLDGSISELAAGRDFVYLINREDLLSGDEYKLAAEKENDVFIKCMYGSYNGHNSLYYAAAGFVPVSDRIGKLNDDAFINILKEFFGVVIMVKNCKGLNAGHIIVSLNKIFLSETDGSIRVTYVPMDSNDKADGFEMDMRNAFASIITNIPGIRSPKSEGFVRTLSDSSVTLEMLYSMMGGNVMDMIQKASLFENGDAAQDNTTAQNTAPAPKPSAAAEATVLTQNTVNAPAQSKEPEGELVVPSSKAANSVPQLSEKMRQMNNEQGHTGYLAGTLMPRIRLENLNGEIPEFVINKDNFVIGRSTDSADYAVLETAVSRTHCKISQVGNRVAVIDLGSANGTFVNGARLNSGEARYISDKDVLRIGHSDFLIRFPQEFIEGEAAAREKLIKAANENTVNNENSGESAESVKPNIEPKKAESSLRPSGKTRILMVHSATGGAGKTTVALGLSRIISKDARKVLYICTSSYQNFSFLMKEKTRTDVSNISGCIRYADVEKYVVHSDFDYIPELRRTGISENSGISDEKYIRIIEAIKAAGVYDIIIVDTESVMNKLNSYLIEKADQILVVTGQGRHQYAATTGFAELISVVASGKCTFVVNNFDQYEYDAPSTDGSFDNIDISAYIEHFRNYDALTYNDLARCEELIKLAGRVHA